MAGTLYPQVWSGHEIPPAAPPEPPPRWKQWRASVWHATRVSARWCGGLLANWWRNGSTNTRIALALGAVLALVPGISSAVHAIWPAPAELAIAAQQSV